MGEIISDHIRSNSENSSIRAFYFLGGKLLTMHLSGFVLLAVISVAVGSYIPHHHEIHHHPQPYAFGYSVKDHHGEQHREESGDGHGVRGSYGFTDSRGVHRQVHYVADHGGFRAEVKTNEPGTANQDPAAVKMVSSAHNGGYALGHGVAASVIGGPVGIVGHGHAGYRYSGPLHGGYVSRYDSRYGYV